MAKTKVSKEQRKVIRDARKIIDEIMKMDSNEAETRRRVERIFKNVMGYDVFKHLTRERAVKGAGETEHVDFAIQLEQGPDARPIVMIELRTVVIENQEYYILIKPTREGYYKYESIREGWTSKFEVDSFP